MRFLEANEACSFAIPRQSVTVGGYLRVGEKETPRKTEARILGGIYAHSGLPRGGVQSPRAQDVCSGFFTRVRGGVSDPIGTAALRPVRT